MAIATLTIEDINLDTGEVKFSGDVEGSTTDDGFMTASEVMLRFLLEEVQTVEFRNKLWSKIGHMTDGRQGCEISNLQHAPDNDTGDAAAASASSNGQG